MSDKTDLFEAAVIDYFLRPGVAAPARPAALFLGLASASADAEAGAVTEIAAAGYQRQSLTFGPSAQVGGGARTSNTADVLFAEAPAGGYTYSHFLIADALNGGRVFVVKAVTGGPVTLAEGDQARFRAGSLTYTEL